MPKIVLDNIANLDRLAKINENFKRIEDYINDKVFSRQPDGNANHLLDSLNVNNKPILNLPEASSPTDALRKIDMEEYLTDTFTPYLEREYGLGDGYNPSVWNAKQDVLVSGVNIKTVNGTALLGSGNIVIAGGGGGTDDHSVLTNRDIADQHPIASITGLTSALSGKANTTHTHSTSDVTGLDSALAGKAPVSHVHDIAGVTGLQAALDSKAALAHSHGISDTTGLQAALDSKAAVSHTHTIANVTGLQTALDSKQVASANLRNIHIGTTAPVDTSFLWLDTN